MTVQERAGARSPFGRESTPIPLWGLAILTLLPFPVSAGVYGYGPPVVAREALTVLLTWSAVVLSFIAGVRWGLETSRRSPRWDRLALSLVFAALAWLLLLARWRLQTAWTLGLYLAAFMLQWLSDHALPKSAWARFPKLSTAVTAAACVSLAVALDEALRG
jgi:hypothetical protein